MPIRNILVAFNGTATSEHAVRLAILLARRHDAHLTGLYAHSMPAYVSQLDAYLPQDSMAVIAKHDAEQTKKIEKDFNELVAAEGMANRVSFYAIRGFPNDVYSEFARTYDVTVIGQPEGDAWQAYREAHPDTVALQSGRPVLIAPRGFAANEFSGATVLAWDGKRAAARALSDAMDFLDASEKIMVLHVGDSDEAVRRPGRDIMEHLSRHDIRAELNVQSTNGRSISQVVLDTCALAGAGLLVMGAYEHSRFSETLLGGVTKGVLGRSEIPVLIAH